MRYRVEARRFNGKGRMLWSETTFKEADSPKRAALLAGMPATYRSYHRVHDGGAYEDPEADRLADQTRWIVVAESDGSGTRTALHKYWRVQSTAGGAVPRQR